MLAIQVSYHKVKFRLAYGIHIAMHLLFCYDWLAIMAFVQLINNGNDPPACTPNLEFSDEKQKIIE